LCRRKPQKRRRIKLSLSRTGKPEAGSLSGEIIPRAARSWASGERNAAAIWRNLRATGFACVLRIVTEWATRRRRSDEVSADTLARLPPVRRIARLLSLERGHLAKAETVLVAAIEDAVPELPRSRRIVDDFDAMIRNRKAARS
jgi:hypothetical protein